MRQIKEGNLVFVYGYGDCTLMFVGIDASNGKAVLKDGRNLRFVDIDNVIPVYLDCGGYNQLYVKLQDIVNKTKNPNYRQILRLLSEIAVKYDLSEVKTASLLTHAIVYIKRCKTTNIIDLGKFRNNCDAFAYLQSDLKRKQEEERRVGRFLLLEEVRVSGYGNTRFWVKDYANGKYTVFDKSNTSMEVNESNIIPILAEDSGKTTLMEAAVSMVPSREEIFSVKNEDCAVIDENSLKVREMKAEVALHELLISYSIEGVRIPEMKYVYSKTFNFDKEQEVLFLERIVDRLQKSSKDDEMDALKLSYVILLSAGDIIEYAARREIGSLGMSEIKTKNKLKIQEKPVCLDGVEEKYGRTVFMDKYKAGDFIYEVSPDKEFTKKYVVTSAASDRIDAVEVVKGVTYRFSPDDEFTRFSKQSF